jgi:serine/threonine protein kinase
MKSQIGEYEIIARCGAGSHSKVYKVKKKNQKHETVYALKKMAHEPTAEREVDCLLACQHENVVRMHDYFEACENGKGQSQFIVLDLYPHSLADILKVTRLTMHQSQDFFLQLLRGLTHIHSQGIVHLDIKPANILIKENQLAITDFGISLRHDEKPYQDDYVSLWYRPPELIRKVKEYSQNVDVWSAACVFMEMIMGRPMFASSDENEILGQIQSRLPRLETLISNLNDAGFDILRQMLTQDQRTRISAQDALAHRFFHVDDTQL